MSELTWVPLGGALYAGQEASFAEASYARLVTRVTIKAITAPTDAAGATFKLKLAGTLQAQVYTLPQGDTSVAITVDSSGLQVAALAALAVVVVAPGYASDLTFWIESQATSTGTADTWQVPTASDLQVAISAPEYTAFTSSVLTTGQADPVPQIIVNCVNEIRDAIRTGKVNSLGPDGTIPGGAMNLFLDGAQWFFFKRVKASAMGDKTLMELKKQWDEGLDKIREGGINFIEPTTPNEDDVVPTGAWGSETYFEPSTNIEYSGENDLAGGSVLPDTVGTSFSDD